MPGIGAGTGKLLLSGGISQTVTQTGASVIAGGWEINKSTTSNSVILGSSLTIPCPLVITYGTFDQGASYNLTLSNTLSLTGANSILRNTGNGDLYLGANVTNNGLVDFNGYGYSCGDADDIIVTSTPAATARSWSGTGRIRMYDVTPSYMTGTQSAYCISSTNGGGNGSTWIFKNSCEIDTVSRSIGTASGVLYSTTGSTNNTGDTVTLSSGTLPQNVGEGDSVRVNSNSSFIRKKINLTQFILQSPVGVNLSGQPINFYRRYTSVAAWNTARATDLVAQNTIEKGVCYNDGDIPGGTIGVFYTDSAHYPILTSEPSQKHKGVFGSGVRINSSLTVSSKFAVVDGLEIFPATRNNGIRANNSRLKIRNNLLKNVIDGIYLHDGNGASDCYIYNNIFYDASNRGISSYINNNAANGNSFYHNTFYKCATGLYTGGTRANHDTVVNNIAIGNTVNYSLSVTNTYADFNAGESGNMPQEGLNNVTTTPLETFADTSTAGLNLALSAASQCINSADSSLPSKILHTDIVDTIRSRYNKWDMGAFEFGGLAFQYFSGTHTYTIGTSSNINVSVASVTGTGPWTITFSGNPDLSQININDCFTDGYTTQGKWKITSVDDVANTVTVQNTEYASGSGTYPSSRNDLQAT
ncbi:MAG: hypothetical protein JNL74_10045, partial [Fibrobacteres bacterium]|nr:hypothetical protein [Fibrobacterota bacterium]